MGAVTSRVWTHHIHAIFSVHFPQVKLATYGLPVMESFCKLTMSCGRLRRGIKA